MGLICAQGWKEQGTGILPARSLGPCWTPAAFPSGCVARGWLSVGAWRRQCPAPWHCLPHAGPALGAGRGQGDAGWHGDQLCKAQESRAQGG